MEKSYREILKIMDFLGKDPEGFVFRGRTEPLAMKSSLESLACDAIIAEAMRHQKPILHVVKDPGACTNIATILLRRLSSDYGGMAGEQPLAR